MNLHKEGISFLKLVNHSFKLKLFLFTKLPLAFLAGVKLEKAEPQCAIATITYKWINQNPFGSIYFAALSMAAELSTGVLAMMHLYGRKPPISMLVTANTAEFYKKAKGKITFTCNQGIELKNTIERCLELNEAQCCTVDAIGIDTQGNQVAKFSFTWSFKARS